MYDNALAAVLALAQARLPACPPSSANNGLQPVSVSEVVPSAAPAAGLAPSWLIALRPNGGLHNSSVGPQGTRLGLFPESVAAWEARGEGGGAMSTS